MRPTANYKSCQGCVVAKLLTSFAARYTISLIAGWLVMILKKLSSNLCLLTLSLQLCFSAFACLEDCHSQVPSCHREQVREPRTPACSHSNAASGFAMAAKS